MEKNDSKQAESVENTNVIKDKFHLKTQKKGIAETLQKEKKEKSQKFHLKTTKSSTPDTPKVPFENLKSSTRTSIESIQSFTHSLDREKKKEKKELYNHYFCSKNRNFLSLFFQNSFRVEHKNWLEKLPNCSMVSKHSVETIKKSEKLQRIILDEFKAFLVKDFKKIGREEEEFYSAIQHFNEIKTESWVNSSKSKIRYYEIITKNEFQDLLVELQDTEDQLLLNCIREMRKLKTDEEFNVYNITFKTWKAEHKDVLKPRYDQLLAEEVKRKKQAEQARLKRLEKEKKQREQSKIQKPKQDDPIFEPTEKAPVNHVFDLTCFQLVNYKVTYREFLKYANNRALERLKSAKPNTEQELKTLIKADVKIQDKLERFKAVAASGLIDSKPDQDVESLLYSMNQISWKKLEQAEAEQTEMPCLYKVKGSKPIDKDHITKPELADTTEVNAKTM